MTSKLLNKIAAFALIATTLMGLLSLFVFEQDFFSNISYAYHEFNAILVIVSIVLIFIEIIGWLVSFYFIRMNKTQLFKSTKLLNIISSIAIVLSIVALTTFFNGSTTSGYYTNIKKQTLSEKYYITLDNRKVCATEEQYNYINVTKGYDIEYKWNEILQTSRILYIRSDK